MHHQGQVDHRLLQVQWNWVPGSTMASEDDLRFSQTGGLGKPDIFNAATVLSCIELVETPPYDIHARRYVRSEVVEDLPSFPLCHAVLDEHLAEVGKVILNEQDLRTVLDGLPRPLLPRDEEQNVWNAQARQEPKHHWVHLKCGSHDYPPHGQFLLVYRSPMPPYSHLCDGRTYQKRTNLSIILQKLAKFGSLHIYI